MGTVEVVDTLAVSGGHRDCWPCTPRNVPPPGRRPQRSSPRSRRCSPNVRLYGAIDTLEYLRRGGRIGGAQALLGTMLKVKPVISLRGRRRRTGRARTHARRRRSSTSPGSSLRTRGGIDRLVVLNGDAPDTDRFLSMLRRVVAVPASDIWTLGPIVGAHAGPGIIGVAYLVRATPAEARGPGVSPEESASA